MSHFGAVLLALLCVCLTATAQVLLKMGMSSPAIQHAMSTGMRSVYWLALTSPAIWGGMICFGASAGLWLLVLGKLEVSLAYPLVSLGVVLTTLAGILILGESAGIYKVLGVAMIVGGVLVLSIKN
jgi:multidrug transporter EmrE-like cation transporter